MPEAQPGLLASPAAPAPAPAIPIEPVPANDRPAGGHAFDDRPPAAEFQAAANLRKDAEATGDGPAAQHQASPIDHAIHKAEADAFAEGNNLFVSPAQ